MPLEPVSMELLKVNARHVHLACPCGKQFWGTPSTKAIACTACKTPWNGEFIKYIKVQMRYKITDDYFTVIVGKDVTLRTAITSLMEADGEVLYFMSGLIVTEMTQEEFYRTDPRTTEKGIERLKEVIQEIVANGQS